MDVSSPDYSSLKAWIGRRCERTDLVSLASAEALAATLDRGGVPILPGDELPLLWHWLLFTPREDTVALEVDGHPRRGGILPPVPLPRRMWAGGRLQFEHALRIGEEISRTTTVTSVEVKAGRSGTLAFVTLRHEIVDARGLALTEDQDIVYRTRPDASRPPALSEVVPAPKVEFERTILPTAVFLFRYSALTFNSHRIHYDRDYATSTEHYPGLVVQAPLLATLLVELSREHAPGAHPRRFAFKAMSPLFDSCPVTLCGRNAADGHQDLWARSPDGGIAMQARFDFY